MMFGVRWLMGGKSVLGLVARARPLHESCYREVPQRTGRLQTNWSPLTPAPMRLEAMSTSTFTAGRHSNHTRGGIKNHPVRPQFLGPSIFLVGTSDQRRHDRKSGVRVPEDEQDNLLVRGSPRCAARMLNLEQ